MAKRYALRQPTCIKTYN